MNGYQRILATLNGQPVDSLPQMPITMMFAADLAGVSYRQYASDYRRLVESQLRTAEKFDFDYVSCISDPAREAADCGATIQYFENQPRQSTKRMPCWPTRRGSPSSRSPIRSRAVGCTIGCRRLACFGKRWAASCSSKVGSKAPVPKRPTCEESTR